MPDGHSPHDVPADRHYDRDNHTWAKFDPAQDLVIVGIDTFGLDAIGDLAYLSLVRPGQVVQRGTSLGSLEAAKMTGEILAPLSGQVVAVNEFLLQKPSLANADPYGRGWFAAIRPSAWAAESQDLVSGEAIKQWQLSEEERYRSRGRVRA
jgi:glycine cleavage system H protein